MQPTALYVDKDSVYKKLGIDSWDITRDATLWPGGTPVIVHPPCRGWSTLRRFSNHPCNELLCATLAVYYVRTYGGILEHPYKSKLWNQMSLPYPGTTDNFGGYSILINQSWFDHKAEKKTLLYIVGIPQKNLPSIPYSLDAVSHSIGKSRKYKTDTHLKKEVSKKERNSTPIRLAQWLVQAAAMCRI